MQSLPNEIWKNYNENYQISNLGRWYSTRAKKIVKQEPNNKGYMRIGIWSNNTRKRVFTHVAVVVAFGDCNGNSIEYGSVSRDEINHKDKNKANNAQSNLEIVSHSENCKRKFA